jgi:signal transduction histidine kinase
LPTKFKLSLLTDTVKRFLYWNVGIFLIVLLSFNLFIIIITGFVLDKNLDNRLRHETENILKTIVVRSDSIILLNNKELEETDFKEVKENSFFLQIYDEQGNILMKSKNVDKFLKIPVEHKTLSDNYFFCNLDVGSNNLRTVYYRFKNSYGKVIAYMQLSIFKTGMNLILKDVLVFNLLSLPIVLLIIFFASIFLAKKTLLPINKIIETAEKISTRNLAERINYKADPSDEIGRLRDTLNNLFARLEIQVNQISQFTDHASHQLINPLTIAKTELDYILRKERNAEDYKNSIELLKDQIEKMIKIINHLLIISKHEDEQRTQKSVFNLSKLVTESIERKFNNANLSFQVEPDIYLRGNSEIFSIVIENLIDNAIKYSGNNPEVNVTLRRIQNKVQLSVADNGIGIEDSNKEKIFERFFRTNKAEELGIKGYGLGLSVAKSIITQMNGSISVEDNVPQGAVFIIRLPEVRVE